jgi:hypothetical protein
LNLSSLKIILFGTIAIDGIAIVSVVYMISVLPRHRVVIHQREIFPQVVQNLQNQPADQGRLKSLTLLQKSNKALDSTVSLTEWLTYSTVTVLLLNAGVLVFCVYQFRGTKKTARSENLPVL